MGFCFEPTTEETKSKTQNAKQQPTQGHPAALSGGNKTAPFKGTLPAWQYPPLQRSPPPMCSLAGYSRLCPTMPQAFGHATSHTCSGRLRRVRSAADTGQPRSALGFWLPTDSRNVPMQWLLVQHRGPRKDLSPTCCPNITVVSPDYPELRDRQTSPYHAGEGCNIWAGMPWSCSGGKV